MVGKERVGVVPPVGGDPDARGAGAVLEETRQVRRGELLPALAASRREIDAVERQRLLLRPANDRSTCRPRSTGRESPPAALPRACGAAPRRRPRRSAAVPPESFRRSRDRRARRAWPEIPLRRRASEARLRRPERRSAQASLSPRPRSGSAGRREEGCPVVTQDAAARQAREARRLRSAAGRGAARETGGTRAPTRSSGESASALPSPSSLGVRAVRLAEVGREELLSAVQVALRRREAGARPRQIRRRGLAEPGEIALPGSARNERQDVSPNVLEPAAAQKEPVSRHVVETGEPGGRAQAAREADSS